MSFFKQVNILFIVLFVSAVLMTFKTSFPMGSLMRGVGFIFGNGGVLILYMLALILIPIYKFFERKLGAKGCDQLESVIKISIGLIVLSVSIYLSSIYFLIYSNSEDARIISFKEYLIINSNDHTYIAMFFMFIVPFIAASVIRLNSYRFKQNLNDDILDTEMK